MIEGEVDSRGVPVVWLPVAGGDWRAVIDTGFNGDLELPYALDTAVNPRFAGHCRSFLAGEQEIEEDQYLVRFPFDGAVVNALATFVQGDTILVGTHMLLEYLLEINFLTGTVKLSRQA